ncbi:MAG: cation transporter [Hadesarchaea archaeon]|nr:cation transporter [Hadesarchaea archaeon]
MKIQEKKKKVRRIIAILIFLNLSLFLVKWVPTLIFHSLSVKADAFNSLGDLAYSGLILLGFEILFKPRDKSHPQGHERIEPFISLIIAGAIGFTGILVVKQAIENFFTPAFEFTPYFLMALLISVITKFWLSKFMERKGKEIDSSALIDSSKDAKVDVVASLTALIGVIGGLKGIPLFDTILGLAVSGWIFKTAYDIGKKNIGFLIGSSAPKEKIKKIKNILNEREQVTSYHNLIAHYVGPEIHISVSIQLPEELDFKEVHEIEESLQKEIREIEGIKEVYLHLEPVNNYNES